MPEKLPDPQKESSAQEAIPATVEHAETPVVQMPESLESNAARVADTMENDRQQLQALREKLGIPQKPEEPKTPDANEISDARLEEKRVEIAAERERGLREGAEQVAIAGELFRAEVQRRDKNGMDPFFDSKAFSSIGGGIQGLRTFTENKGEVSLDDLFAALSALTSGLEKMGQTRRGGTIRENEASLGRLAMSARDLFESSAKMRNYFREGDENASRAAKRLQDVSERVYGFVGRLRVASRN